MIPLTKTTTKRKKVVVSGGVIEVFEYERMPLKNPKKGEDEDNPLELAEPSSEDRTDERRKQTTRDARNLTRRLALMNFGHGDKFLTLTFRKHYTVEHICEADAEFKKFVKRFKYKYKLDDFKYIAVREFMKNGRLHYHMICNWKEQFENEEQIKKVEREIGQPGGTWGNGFVDVKNLDHVDNIGAYIVKYMTKNVALELFKGKKIYLCSKGLQRPLEYTDYNAQLIIDQYDLEQKKEVFSNAYLSEHHGIITYKEYNLLRN